MSVLWHQFQCLTIENLGERRFYFDINDKPLDIQEGTKQKVSVQLNSFDTPFLLWNACGKIKASFDDTFRTLLRDKENLGILKYAPKFIKYECSDKYGDLILHKICASGLSSYVRYFINADICNRVGLHRLTPLHHACLSNDLGTVIETMKYDGHRALGMKNKEDEYPINLTTNEEIKNFLEKVAKLSKVKVKMLYALRGCNVQQSTF